MRQLPLLFLFLLLGNFSIAQLFTFKNFSYKDGLSMANVSCITQLDDGSIWIGTDGAGLVKFNGYNFHEEYSEKDDNNHHVTSIIEDKGLIYFTSKYKGVYSYSNHSYSRIVAPNISMGEFQKVLLLDSSKIIITTTGIFQLKEKKLKRIFSFNSAKENLKINQIIDLKGGYILLTNRGNFHLSAKTCRLVPLNNWLHVSKEAVKFIEYGYVTDETLNLFDRNLTTHLEVILNYREGIYKLNTTHQESPLKPNEFIISFYRNQKNKTNALLTSQNGIYRSNDKKFVKVAHNFDKPLEECKDLIIDRNGDYWVTSSVKGIYKISLEPFTKIQLHPIYNSSSIGTIYKSTSGDIVISAENESTFIANIEKIGSQFDEFKFQTNAIIEYKHQLFLGTDHGIKIFDCKTKQIKANAFDYLANEKITFLFLQKDHLWVGAGGKGLLKIDLSKSLKNESLDFDRTKFPYIYTAQISDDQKHIYFGTNNGICAFNLKQEKFTTIKTPKSIGSYIGVSTKDIYGNIWFTGESALFGILKNGNYVVLDDKRMFPSTLFYTLNSDNYGNLIIGTNKGINIVKLNEYGEVLNYNWYQGKSGFEGYETNMRAQFQDGNSIFVGTVEGLYLINTSILQNIPIPSRPVILTDDVHLAKNDDKTIVFQFLVNNPKLKNIQFSYRIVGYQNKWSNFTKENKLILTDLPNGDYIIEVKATNDGVVFSETGSYPFSIQLSFWKSKWFILLLLLSVVLINIYLINKNRSFSKGNLFETNESSITVKLTPQILLFGFLSDSSIYLLSPLIDSGIANNLGLTLINGFILMALYLLSLTAKKNNRTYQFKYILIAGFLCALMHSLINIYYSNLHTFFIIAVILINSLAPFIFERVKTVVIYSSLFLLVNCIIAVLLENTIYNKSLFIIAMGFSAFFGVIVSYLRYDSLEKLLFISKVINKGNIPTIAFNSEGIITYASENISETIKIGHEDLIGKHISFLNSYVPEEGNFRRVDLTSNFEDGKKYLVPMISPSQEINWMEWSCKVFTENVKVILGQNVTKRLELENTYELLVQNAEDLIYKCDENGFFSFLNNRCYDILDFTENDLIGKHSIDLVPNENKEEVASFYKKHFEEKKTSSYFEFPILTKGGKIIWLGQYVTTLYKPGEKKVISGFLALARDITIKRKQQEIIKEQRDDITASINYAQKIQLNLLPNKEKFNYSFNESCLIYKPKDIVSGDFFWFERIDDISIIALADCTGHGVPGAFMTLLGINLITNIVLEQRIQNPGRILDEIDKKLIHTLPREQNDEKMNDGMEITICVFNHVTLELAYACAGSRFLMYESNSFTMYKGDSKHIGDIASPEFKGYITHYTKFNCNSTIYLFTDGFQDQFGGIKNKKYSFRRMLELFESNIRLPLIEQQSIITEEFETWRSEFSQTDDISIIILRGLSNDELS